MKDEAKDWLLNEFPKFIGRTLMKDTLHAYYKAEMLLKGYEQIKRRSCSCQYRGLKTDTENSYNKWVNEQKQIPNGK